jgi:hypothetical protein
MSIFPSGTPRWLTDWKMASRPFKRLGHIAQQVVGIALNPNEVALVGGDEQRHAYIKLLNCCRAAARYLE